MRCYWILMAAAWIGLTGLLRAEQPATSFSDTDLTFFEKRVRPILVQRCHECHASTTPAAKLRGGLMLDTRDAVLKGGDTGPAAESGQPEKSLLVEAIRYDSQQIQMPPAGKIPDAEIAVLTEWIQRGLPFPASTTTQQRRHGVDIEAGKSHWAFQPLTSVVPSNEVPADLSNWPQSGIDRFVLSSQLQHHLRPATPADRAALIRRVKLDLLGLPPTRDEIDAFVGDPAPNAYERLVDGYLAAPQYGERWGRHWLDLARYCDVPESWREGVAQAWLYRDWVVQALNEDIPYDEFVRWQFAADLRPNAEPRDNAALGFLGLSPTYWKELKLDHLVIKQVVAEEWEERIEAIGATFLGLTLACARCHDHKFDPITVRDYYGLAGVLASIKLDDQPIIPADQAARARQARTRIKELKKEIEDLLAKKSDENKPKAEELQKQIDALTSDTPEMKTPEVFGVMEASLQVLPDGAARTKLEFRDQPQDVAIQIRGNASNPGAIVPRGFPAVLSNRGPIAFTRGSGRAELADAIVTDAAPLAARVFVNRIWKHHFGRGLVTTLSNFGTQGDLPSHPELLDDLAARFIEHGWSLKWLHREIVLSATYRQSSVPSKSQMHMEKDPDNIWLARMPLRRLDVEAWRDSMLASTGELDLRIGGASGDLLDIKNHRRTIYGTVKRRELADLLRLHDFPDPVSHVASREPTTTPLQQLFVLNSPLMRERSRALIRRLDADQVADAKLRIGRLVEWVLLRDATTDEETAMADFVAATEKDIGSKEEAWVELAQVLLGSNELLFVE